MKKNRGRGGISSTVPSADEVKAARESANLTQEAAARLLNTTGRVFRNYESGRSRIHPSMWELFLIKIGKV